VSLAVGVRNSLDTSFPMGFAAGSRVFCCDNLALRAELLVRKKHTVHGLTRFNEAIANSVTGLKQFQMTEASRITRMREIEVDDVKAESVILRAYAANVISHRTLPGVLGHWREPEHDEFRARTVFSLLNAFTSAMGPRLRSNPHAYTASTMRLFGVLDGNFPIAIAAEPSREVAA
jgi:GDP-D-mannose dehydratase